MDGDEFLSFTSNSGNSVIGAMSGCINLHQPWQDTNIIQLGPDDSSNVRVGRYNLQQMHNDLQMLLQRYYMHESIFEHEHAVLMEHAKDLQPYEAYCGNALCARFRLHTFDLLPINLIRLCFDYLDANHSITCSYQTKHKTERQ